MAEQSETRTWTSSPFDKRLSAPRPTGSRWVRATALILVLVPLVGCVEQVQPAGDAATLTAAARVVEERVWEFHAADTSRNAEGVISLLWPEYEMLVDGHRTTYNDVVQGSRSFMAGLETFHTVWSDLRVTALSPDIVVSSFVFRDSIVTQSGELMESRGPTTLVWEKREGEWRVRYGDADHYPVREEGSLD